MLRHYNPSQVTYALRLPRRALRSGTSHWSFDTGTLLWPTSSHISLSLMPRRERILSTFSRQM